VVLRLIARTPGDKESKNDRKEAGLRMQKPQKAWKVYMILASDSSLYTGITTDIERRFRQHGEKKGARFFRGRSPLRVVYLEGGHSRSTASQREAEIKKLQRRDKLQLIQSHSLNPGDALIANDQNAGLSVNLSTCLKQE
jgi:putative endonuclease